MYYRKGLFGSCDSKGLISFCRGSCNSDSFVLFDAVYDKKNKKDRTYSLKWNEWFVLLIIPVISIFTMSFVSLIIINIEEQLSPMQHIFQFYQYWEY